jgi:predicted small integral membrane protein
MPVRYLKIALVGFVSLMCLMYATQNVVNLDAAYGFVAGATSPADHRAYPSSFGPALSAPVLIWGSLAVIIGLEYAAGLLAAKGAWDLWSARRASAETFNRAKTYAVLGAGTGVVVWFGLFAVIGGAYFQMWQTQLGSAALSGAFQFAMQCGLVLLFVSMTDG